MVTSKGRRSLRYGTDSLLDLSLVLQEEIHDLFTVTLGNSWAICMCVHMHILFIFIYQSADVKLCRKKQSIRQQTIMTQNGELCLFLIIFCAFPQNNVRSTNVYSKPFKYFIQDPRKSNVHEK